MPRDVLIWERFITAHPAAFDAVAYDVPVGEGAAFDTTVNPDTGGNAEKLYKKKIDVVGSKGEVLYIIEVKPEAGPSALGQIKANTLLFKRDHEPRQVVQAVIITDVLKPDMQYLAQEEGINLIIA